VIEGQEFMERIRLSFGLVVWYNFATLFISKQPADHQWSTDHSLIKTALEARFTVSVNATCIENMTERNIQKILSITDRYMEWCHPNQDVTDKIYSLSKQWGPLTGYSITVAKTDNTCGYNNEKECTSATRNRKLLIRTHPHQGSCLWKCKLVCTEHFNKWYIWADTNDTGLVSRIPWHSCLLRPALRRDPNSSQSSASRNQRKPALNPRTRLVLGKLTVTHAVKKSSFFYETRRYITAFNTAHHQSPSSARLIQSTPSNLFPYQPF
jgi:hypothetical protein